MEDLNDYYEPEQAYNKFVILQYSRSRRSREAEHRRPTVFPRQHQRSVSRQHQQVPCAPSAGGPVRQHSNAHQSKQRHREVVDHDQTGTKHHNFVSFYLTNVSKDISYFSLRQGFEVAGERNTRKGG